MIWKSLRFHWRINLPASVLLLALILGNGFLPTGFAEPNSAAEQDPPMIEVDSAGHKSAPLSSLDIPSAVQQKLKKAGKKYTIIVILHYLYDWSNLVIKGVQDECKPYNIDVKVMTNKEFSLSKQILNIERAIDLKPNAIISIPVNESIQGPVYKKIARSGIHLILLDMIPKGLTYPQDYDCLISSSNRGIGVIAADIMAKKLGGKGKVGILELAFPFYVTEQKVYGFEQRLKHKYPGIKVTARTKFGGESVEMKEAQQKTEQMLIAHSYLDGMFAVWMDPACAAAKAAKTLGRKPDNFVITTSDIEEKGALEIAADSFVKGCGAEDPYSQGKAAARAAIRSFSGLEDPPYIAVPALKVTRDNLLKQYREILHRDPPANLIRLINQPASDKKESK